jgi:hypothetical protein
MSSINRTQNFVSSRKTLKLCPFSLVLSPSFSHELNFHSCFFATTMSTKAIVMSTIPSFHGSLSLKPLIQPLTPERAQQWRQAIKLAMSSLRSGTQAFAIVVGDSPERQVLLARDERLKQLVQSTGWVNPPGIRVRVGRVWVRVTIHPPLHKPAPVNGLTGVYGVSITQ